MKLLKEYLDVMESGQESESLGAFTEFKTRLGQLESKIDTLAESAELKDIASGVDELKHVVFNSIGGLEHADRMNTRFFESLYNSSGSMKSSASLTPEERTAAEVHFHHRDKSEIAMTVCSSWYGGDYFEFGAQDLATFRNMLSAYHICGMTQQYQDVRFYAFDMFGDPTVNAPEYEEVELDDSFKQCFSHYLAQGDQIEQHYDYIKQHGLFEDQCHLVQGLFENTLTKERRQDYLQEGRHIGFAFLDCNMDTSYELVFDYIFEMMGEQSYIYMDEYFQNPSVIRQYDRFTERLKRERGIGSIYLRNAGGFGGLFRLYPLI